MSKTQSMQELIEGLKPALESHARGMVYQETNQTLAAKLVDAFRTMFSLPEVDQIIITPKLTKSATGADDMIATMYFAVGKGGNGNIFYRGKGNNKNTGGRLNMVAASGYGSGGTGVFNTSDEFKKVISPFCKTDNNGRPIMNLRTVQGVNGVASLEVDFMSLLCLFLGIESDDPYDCSVFEVAPVANTDNVYNMMIIKYIMQGGNKNRGKTGVNYGHIAQEQFNRINGRGNGGNNGGGRSY